MRLFILRHAEAQTKEENPDRPLSDVGKQKLNKLGALLKANDIQFSKIYHSSKLRAEETATIISSLTDSNAKPEEIEGLEPNDPLDKILEKIQKINSDLLVVGHLPQLNLLITKLLSDIDNKEIINLNAGTLVCCEQQDDKTFQLLWCLDPALVS